MDDLILPDLPKKRAVRAFFTTKQIGAKKDAVAARAGIGSGDIYFPDQRHTGRVHLLRGEMRERVADAVITRRKNVLLGVRVADCVPLLLYDRSRMACGAVHAGWRGTADGIVVKTIDAMREQFFSDPADLVIAIGPAIRWCCYEVGEEVLRAVIAATGEGDYHGTRDGSLCLDLPTANVRQAVGAGVPEGQIWMSDECTYCSPERFYSYRYAKRVAGNQGGFIGVFV